MSLDEGYRLLEDNNNSEYYDNHDDYDDEYNVHNNNTENINERLSNEYEYDIDIKNLSASRQYLLYIKKSIIFYMIFIILVIYTFISITWTTNNSYKFVDVQQNINNNSVQKFDDYFLQYAKFEEETNDHSVWMVDTPSCRLPNSPIFDNETRKIFKETYNKPWPCSKPTFMAKVRRVNYTFVQLPAGHICTVREVIRTWQKEWYGFGKKFERQSGLVDFDGLDAVEVKCNGSKLAKVIPLIPHKKTNIGWFASSSLPSSPSSPLPSQNKYNILLFGIDSLSRLNFHRHLLKTDKFVQNHDFIEFYGHHKVGDNSFPNIIPIMIGDLSYNWTRLWNKDKKLDALPLIFEKFQRAGYMTTYIEDLVRYGLFTYHLKNGFYKAPTDYFLRPTSLIYEHAGKTPFDACYQDRLQTEIYYEYLLEMFQALKDRGQPLLGHIHMSTITHNYVNNAGYIDRMAAKFLEDFFKKGFNKNTVIVFYADHSIRFGPSVRTKVAYYETKLPIFQVYVPDSLRLMDVNGQYMNASMIRRILKHNSRRLTSHLDVHATMMHILNKMPTMDERYGQSLFLPVSEKRTCEDAGILDEFCACKTWEDVDESDNNNYLASKVVDYINSLLIEYQKKCLPLVLKDVSSIQIRSDFMNSTEFTDRLFTIDFSTRPNNANFRVIVKENRTSIVKPPKIERMDRYGEQSKCVANTNVEQYCFCKELLKTTTESSEDSGSGEN